MATTIETVTIGTADKRLVLSNSQWAASLSIGNNWTTLRIGFRLCFDNIATTLTLPRLYVGMLSSPAAGMTNGPLGSTCSHFVGIRTNTNWNFANSVPPVARYGFTGNTDTAFKKIGATETAGTTTGPDSAGAMSARPTLDRPIFLFEITKGSPNYSVRSSTNISTSPNDQSYTTLYNNMGLAWTSACTNMSLGASTNIGAVAADEVDGALNAVCVAWDRLTPTMHISEILFTKLA